MTRKSAAAVGRGRSVAKPRQNVAKKSPAKPPKVENGKSAKRAINSAQRLFKQKDERDRLIIAKYEELQLKHRIRGQKRIVPATEVFEALRLKSVKDPRKTIELRRVQQLWKEIKLVFRPMIMRRRLKRCPLVNQELTATEVNRVYAAARYFGY